MRDLERRLDGMAPGAGELPEGVSRALRRVRVRRRIVGAGAPVLMLVAIGAVYLGLKGAAPTGGAPERWIAAEPTSPMTLVSLTRANRDSDPDTLRLPNAWAPGSGALRARDAADLASELATR